MKDRTGTEADLGRDLDELAQAYRKQAAGAPPPAVDAAILARARDAVEARRRAPVWGVPAALAATLVIALSLTWRVQQEAASPQEPSDAAPPPPPPAAMSSPAAVTAAEPGPGRSRERITAPPPVATTADPVAADELPAVAAPAPSQARSVGKSPAAGVAAPAMEPEAWLARIEALEAEGLSAQADAERQRLEETYPGWLAEHESGRD